MSLQRPIENVDYLVIIPSRWEVPPFFLLSPFTPFSLRETAKGKVLLFISGIGRYNVEKNVESVLDKYLPQRVILSGFCGSRTGKFPPGTLVLGKSITYQKERLNLEGDYLCEMEKALKNFPFHWVKEEVECVGKLELLKEKGKPFFMDMESFWVMKMCQAKGIPGIFIKIVSDTISSSNRLLLPFCLLKTIVEWGKNRRKDLIILQHFFENYFYP